MLKANQPAPNFSLPNQFGENLSLKDYAGKQNVVLYFYPKDDTPGCTIEANQFTALNDDLSALDTVVIGVSKDSCESHLAFIKKYGLKVALIADVRGRVRRRRDGHDRHEQRAHRQRGDDLGVLWRRGGPGRRVSGRARRPLHRRRRSGASGHAPGWRGI